MESEILVSKNDRSNLVNVVLIQLCKKILESCIEKTILENYIIHDNMATLTPVCYLQDMYVEPGVRAQGVGKQMIDWLVAEMKAQGWARLYWNTKETNYRARGLYDKYTSRDPFVRYVINRPAD